MIIFDNIIFSLQKVGGISVVWQNLLDGIGKIGKDFNAIEYPNSEENIFRQSLVIPFNRIDKRKYRILSVIEQMLDVKVKHNYRPIIFHSSYYRVCNNPNAINITTVHDFIYEKGYAKIGLSERIRMWLSHRAIRRSDFIVCISENTQKDLLHYIPRIDENRIAVIYNGVSEDYHPIEDKIEDYKDCLLFVGGRQDYKNFGFAVNVAAESGHRLIICGNNLSDNEKTLLDSVLGSQGYVFKLRPDNSELNKIYNSVLCLLYPSSYEGFGIPILEAQRAGCPVIAFNSSSIPEVIGKGGMLMDKLDCDQAISFISKLKDIKFRSSIIADGLKNAARFSWSKMAHEYLDLYNKLLAERKSQ